MRSKIALIRAIPVRVKPVTAAVATAVGSVLGVNIAAVAATPDELVVSATRRDTSVQDVPYSISALSGDDLAKLQVNDLSDVARWSTGLIQVDQGARDANLLIIRGINSGNIDSPELLNNSTGERVATYYGETPVYINLQPIDLERIEVLRGPQGTIFGARSLAGAVRYIPARPDTSEFSLDAHVRAYNTEESGEGSRDLDAVINIPLVEDTLALRALLGYSYTAGFINQPYLVPVAGVSCPEPGNTAGCSDDGFNSEDDVDDAETRSYGLALGWTPTDNFEAVLSWRHQNRSIGGRSINSRDSLELIEQVRAIDLDASNYTSGMRFTEPSQRKNSIANLNIIWDTAIGELTSSTSYTTYDSAGRRDQTDFLIDDYYYYNEFPAFSAFTNDVQRDEFVTQEVRLVSDNEGPLNWLVGAYWNDADLYVRSQEITPGYAAYDPFFTTANGDVEYDNITREKNRELAVFGEIGFDVTDRLNLSAGARWFDFDAQKRSCTAYPIAATDPFLMLNPDVYAPENCSPMGEPRKVGDDDILGKLGATFAFSETQNAYAIYSEGYGAAGFNTFAETEAEEAVAPELTKNYELGLKSSWFDDRLTTRAAVYLIDWTDIQVPGRNSLGQLLVRNIAEAESKGLELEATAYLTERLELAAGYAYTRARIKTGCADLNLSPGDAATICGADNVDTASGDRLPGSPEHSGYLRASYVMPVAPDMDIRFIYGLTTQSDVLTKIGVGGSDCCRDNGEALPGFTLHNASVGLESDQWQASLFIENIFNKYAVTGVRTDRTKIAQSNGTPGFVLRRYYQDVIRPRNIGIDIRYSFR